MYSTRYEVSDDGRIRSVIGGVVRLRVLTDHGRYKYVMLCMAGHKKRFVPVHRLVAIAFIPNPHGKPCVNHIDADPSNNTASNLEWCTHAENMRHASAMGLLDSSRGDHNPRSRLTDDDCAQIRASSDHYKQLAMRFGVAGSYIHKIRRGGARTESTEKTQDHPHTFAIRTPAATRNASRK